MYIRKMKPKHPLSSFIRIAWSMLLFVLVISSCKSDQRGEKFLTEFKKNNYDFSNYRWRKWKGLHYQLPNGFIRKNDLDLNFYKQGIVYQVPELDFYIVIDKIPNEKVKQWMGKEEYMEPVDYVHQGLFGLMQEKAFYIDYSFTYFMDNNRLTALGQAIEGQRFQDKESVFYQIATIHKGNTFYCIQLISNAEMGPYLNDDFRTLIRLLR